MSQPQQPAQEQVGGFLGFIERAGNRIPDITMLFIAAFFITCILSAFLSQFHFGYIHPTTGKEIMVTNMLAPKSLVTLMTKMVSNFAGFPPLGMVIVATLGIGIAQGSGYINTGLKKILSVTPRFLMTPIVIVVGMLSHLAPDSGYMIIIPIAAYLFYASGKHPLAGVAASFAGIAGAFAANYTPSAIDPVIQGFTQMAAQLIDPSYEVNVLCNYFFAFAATFPIILVCWWVTEHVTEPWCRKACPLDADIDASEDAMKPITPQENRSFAVASFVLIFLLVGLFAALIPENSLFRDPAGNIASFKAPVMQSIVAIIFLLCAIPGIVYGIMSGTFRSSKDFTHSMEEITHTLVQLIVFYFFAAQFMYAFGASNLGGPHCHCGSGIPEILGPAAADHRLWHHRLCCHLEPAHYVGIGQMVHPGPDFCPPAHERRHRAGTDAGRLPDFGLGRQRLHAYVCLLSADHHLLPKIL